MVCKKIAGGALFLAAWALSGCASATLQSEKAQDYNNTPARIAILTDLGKENHRLGSNLPNDMKSALSSCGIDSSIEQLSDLTIGPQKIAMARPDAILVIRWKTVTSNSRDGVVQAEYHFELTDIASKKVVWKANMQFRPDLYGIGNADTFTKGVLKRLKSDGILPQSCAVA